MIFTLPPIRCTKWASYQTEAGGSVARSGFCAPCTCWNSSERQTSNLKALHQACGVCKKLYRLHVLYTLVQQSFRPSPNQVTGTLRHWHLKSGIDMKPPAKRKSVTHLWCDFVVVDVTLWFKPVRVWRKGLRTIPLIIMIHQLCKYNKKIIINHWVSF